MKGVPPKLKILCLQMLLKQPASTLTDAEIALLYALSMDRDVKGWRRRNGRERH